MKTIVSAALIVAVLSIALVQTGQAVNARQLDANTLGAQAARADFSNNIQNNGSCEDHGYDVTQSPGFCLTFKASYAIQWAILELGQ